MWKGSNISPIKMSSFPYKAPALFVHQPMGHYYVTVLPAKVLLDTCYSDRVRAIPNPTGIGYKLDGTQRGLEEDRLKAIARYIGRFDSAFPNSISLAANFRDEDGMIEEDSSKRWSISCETDHLTGNRENRYSITIPTKERLACVFRAT